MHRLLLTVQCLNGGNVVRMEAVVGHVPPVEGSHQRVLILRMRQAERVTELMRCYLEKVCS